MGVGMIVIGLSFSHYRRSDLRYQKRLFRYVGGCARLGRLPDHRRYRAARPLAGRLGHEAHYRCHRHHRLNRPCLAEEMATARTARRRALALMSDIEQRPWEVIAMLELKQVTKLFFPGTVDEKIALADVNLQLKRVIS